MRLVKPGKINGELSIIGSKSEMQRAVACAYLACGESTILNPTYCDDGLASIGIVKALGAKVIKSQDKLIISSLGIDTPNQSNVLNAMESGLSIRLFTPIAALSEKEFIFNANGTLLNRSMLGIQHALSQMNVRIELTGNNPPIKIKGPIKIDKIISYDGMLGSQVLSGLLTALSVCKENSEVACKDLSSKPYLDITIDILSRFGVNGVLWDRKNDTFKITGNQKFHPSEIKLEGDWSGASFFAVLGAVFGRVKLKGLNQNSKQGDKEILKVLSKIGAKVSWVDGELEIEPGDINAFYYDATHTPDLFPPLASLAVYLDGKSIIKGVSRLAGKESDRAEVILQEFSKVGAKVELKDDVMIIEGGRKITGGECFSHQDHRIAMSLAILAIGSESGINISGDESISKSYPGFFGEIDKLREV